MGVCEYNYADRERTPLNYSGLPFFRKNLSTIHPLLEEQLQREVWMFLIYFACHVQSRGVATPIQAKWIELYLRRTQWGPVVVHLSCTQIVGLSIFLWSICPAVQVYCGPVGLRSSCPMVHLVGSQHTEHIFWYSKNKFWLIIKMFFVP